MRTGVWAGQGPSTGWGDGYSLQLRSAQTGQPDRSTRVQVRKAAGRTEAVAVLLSLEVRKRRWGEKILSYVTCVT